MQDWRRIEPDVPGLSKTGELTALGHGIRDVRLAQFSKPMRAGSDQQGRISVIDVVQVNTQGHHVGQ